MNYFILFPMVYLSLAIFLFGSLFRVLKILRAPFYPATLKIFPQKRPTIPFYLSDVFLFPTVLRHGPFLWVFLMLFHLSLFLLFFGHLKLFLNRETLIFGKGLLGLLTFLSLLFFLLRRFKGPLRELSLPEDLFMLLILILCVIFGAELSIARTSYGYPGMGRQEYIVYMKSLLSFKRQLPTEVSSSGHLFLLTLHIFFANLFLMLFPFSQIMHSILTFFSNRFRRG